jgi:SAM-dependent methyltransferase
MPGRLGAMQIESCRPPVPHVVLRGRQDIVALVEATPERKWFVDQLTAAGIDHEEWGLPGFCVACERPSTFSITSAVGAVPNYRETLICPVCGLNNRQRLIASCFSAALASGGPGKVAYLHEQVTTMYRWATTRHGADHEIVGSEYLGPEHRSGEIVDGVRHEDALALSFADASIDLVLSTDVLEHVPDIDNALAEAARTIRPGGAIIFSVPFYSLEDTTVRRATMASDGSLTHHVEPQHHGNPIAPDKGSLVFFDYGWDLLDRIGAAGFRDAAGIGAWSVPHGIIGDHFQLLFVAIR